MSSGPLGQFIRQRGHAPPKRKLGGAGDAEDESYFDEEPEPTNQGPSKVSRLAGKPVGLGEEDPLDAYMAELNQEIALQDLNVAGKGEKHKESSGWDELAADDPVASYYEAYELGEAGTGEDVGEDDGTDRRNKTIEPLPAIDHSKMNYNVVQTNFYKPHPELGGLSEQEATQLRKDLRISAAGTNVPAPTASFGHMVHVLGKELMEGIRRHGFQQPTPIQAQAIPVALTGRDVIGIAETGSGKTVAYLLPMLVHAAAQPELGRNEGPIGIVLCPTRELAVQIEQEVFKFNKQLGLRSVTLAGGLSKLEQFKEIKRGSEIAICNPGRLIDIVKMKGCTLQRVTFVVVDEADRMFHMGFEYQVRSIVQNVRPSRQVLLFSATFPPKIEKLARDILQQPVRITVGEVGQAAINVSQHVEILKNDDEKWPWLSKSIDSMLQKGQVLIFVRSIESAEELTQNFKDFLDKKTEFLHGDLHQSERMRILASFRKRKVDVLIATDVAARGLDIPSIYTVVSYDVARDIETHTHRIGRTGRAGVEGQAFTLLTSEEHSRKMAALLVEHLEQANQYVSESLQGAAMKYAPYRAAKLAGKKFEAKKKKGEGSGPAKQSTFGVGFDNSNPVKETPQDLERRLNREADKLASANRRIMAGVAGAGRARINFAAQSSGPAGFVAAATSDHQEALLKAIPKPQDDSSDDDLFAPGVKSAFGRQDGAIGPTRGGPFGRGRPRPNPGGLAHNLSSPFAAPVAQSSLHHR